MKYLSITSLLIAILTLSALPSHVMAQEAEAPVFNLPETFEGEITDSMIEGFLKADSRIRALRAQVGELTKKILDEESVSAGLYLAVIQKVQGDEAFIERVRAISERMVAENEASLEEMKK